MTPWAMSAQEAAAAPAAGSPWSSMIGILLMFAVFFFLIILPQGRKVKKQQQFLASLKKGDAVVTQGGLYGRIVGIADKVITLEISPKVTVRVDRQSISGIDPFAGPQSDSGAAA